MCLMCACPAPSHACAQALYAGPKDNMYLIKLANFGFNSRLAHLVADNAVFALVASVVRRDALKHNRANLDEAIKEVKAYIDKLVGRWLECGGLVRRQQRLAAVGAAAVGDSN